MDAVVKSFATIAWNTRYIINGLDPDVCLAPQPAVAEISYLILFLVYDEDYEYAIGKAITTKQGTDATVIACGICVFYALSAALKLAEEGVNVRVIDMHTIKPLDEDAVLRAARETGVIVTAEEHNIIGGLGSAVAETILEAGIPVKFKRLGVPDLYATNGKPEHLHAKYGFDAAGIYSQLKNMLKTSTG